jgi:uncharacterized protein involved in exopolysaccharide biosynthesis
MHYIPEVKRQHWKSPTPFRLPRFMSAPAPRFQRYATVIVRSICTALAVFCATMLAGQYITDNVLAKTYLATAQIQIRPAAPDVSAAADPNYNAVQLGILQSSDFLLPVIEQLGLKEQWKESPDDLKDGAISDEEALARLGQLLTYDTVPGTSIVKIMVKSNEPRLAADIANAIAERYQGLESIPGAVTAPNGHAALILARAEPPAAPSWPDESVAQVITFILAIMFSITATSFVEMILLFQRAGERDGS